MVRGEVVVESTWLPSYKREVASREMEGKKSEG